jgi:hypothetical protein
MLKAGKEFYHGDIQGVDFSKVKNPKSNKKKTSTEK